jgi:glycosyltransferase involved in cell wall biosynthesis
MNPKVSVIMSVLNGDKYLNEAIESILNQTFTDFEFIIINDGSEDKTRDILEFYTDPRIRLFHQNKMGLTKSLNKALSLSTGKYIARQDADDVSLPNRLQQQVYLLDNQSEVVIVGSDCYLIDETGSAIGIWHYPVSDTDIRWQMLFHSSFVHTGVMIRKDTLHKNKLSYDDRMVYSQDYGLWSQLLLYGHGLNMEIPLIKYRVHLNAISHIFNERQKTIADQISLSNLERLGVNISVKDVSTLRDWYKKFPQRLNKQDMELSLMLLKILNEFAKHYHRVSHDPAHRIRQYWISRILHAISWDQPMDLCASPLLWYMFRNESTSLLTHLFRRVKSRIRRVLYVTEKA